MMDRIRKAFCGIRAGLAPENDVTKIATDPRVLEIPSFQEMGALATRAFDLLNQEAPPNVAFVIAVVDLRGDDPEKIVAVDRFSGDLRDKPELYFLLYKVACEQNARVRSTTKKDPTP